MLQRIFPILIVLCFASCVEDVDFEQAETVAISPVLEASLLFFDFDAAQFQEPTGTAIVVEEVELELDFFNDEFLRENLIRAEFFFEVTNSIDRTFRADVIMYDANGTITHAFDISITPGGTNEVEVTHTEVFEGVTLEQLKNTTRTQFILTMFPSDSGVPLDDNSVGNIKMRSKATLFFEIDTQ